jgi:hypothetical protein
MPTLDEYIETVQKELDKAVIDVYRLEGALAMLRKQKAEAEVEAKKDLPNEND